MGHHIDDKGRFQSDKYPDLAPDKIVLSFKDPFAEMALKLYAVAIWDKDRELSDDILARIKSIEQGTS